MPRLGLTPFAAFLLGLYGFAPLAAAQAVPDFSGHWGRAGLFRFEPPSSGPGPVVNTSRFADTVERVGDYTNPILTQKSARIVKERGDLQLAGANFPDPRNQCRLEPPPFILGLEFEILFEQRPDVIDIVYVYGHQHRRIRMNASHPANLTPTAYGDSVGRWEGDTFVVESSGYDDRSWLDRGANQRNPQRRQAGIPHSDELKIVERYKRLNYGLLQLDMTITDPKVFTAPWHSGPNTIALRPDSELGENICVPSDNAEYYNRSQIPAEANK